MNVMYAEVAAKAGITIHEALMQAALHAAPKAADMDPGDTRGLTVVLLKALIAQLIVEVAKMEIAPEPPEGEA